MSAGSWSLGLKPTNDGTSIKSSSVLVNDGAPIEVAGAPDGEEDSEPEFPQENFQSKLREADLDRFRHRY